VVPATVTPPSQKNEPTPVPVTAKDGFWANLIALIKALFGLMISFILENWTSVIAVVVATDVVANKVVKITKSQKDDAVLAAVDKVISVFKT
jgi:hypothetical protein